MSDYIELHCHSCFSFREGASTPLELVLQARRLGYPALALTDHDGLAGAMEFAQTAKEWGVAPIIGAELTLRGGLPAPAPVKKQRSFTRPPAPATSFAEGIPPPLHSPEAAAAARLGQQSSATRDRAPSALPQLSRKGNAGGDLKVAATERRAKDARTHLTLLAETPRGYANLSRLLSMALLESPRGEPALDPAALAGRTEGLIALSGCRDGAVSRRIGAGDVVGARTAASWYAELFGREHYFIELQDNLVYGDRARNRGLVELARELDLAIVATNNVHYHERARHRLQDVLVAVRHRTTLDASERLRRRNAECYLKSPEEMAALFSELPESLRNSVSIAERCVGTSLSQLDACDVAPPLPQTQEAMSSFPPARPERFLILGGHSFASLEDRPPDPPQEGAAPPLDSPGHDRGVREPSNHAVPQASTAHRQGQILRPSAEGLRMTDANSKRGFDLTRDLTYEFPDFQAPNGMTADEFLEEVCFAAARELYG